MSFVVIWFNEEIVLYCLIAKVSLFLLLQHFLTRKDYFVDKKTTEFTCHRLSFLVTPLLLFTHSKYLLYPFTLMAYLWRKWRLIIDAGWHCLALLVSNGCSLQRTKMWDFYFLESGYRMLTVLKDGFLHIFELE
jgi:hypothetical protein